MRLNKYIAAAGVCSRRKADELTKNGNVKINGAVQREPGYDVQPEDRVEVNGRLIEPEEKLIYLMLNKPKACLTAMEDDRGRMTVADLLENVPQRVFPVGRLDADTTGLLLLTNDGELANKLMHPSHEVGKTYRAKVHGTLTRGKIDVLCRGVDIGGYVTAPAKVTLIRQTGKSALVETEIHEGKHRQVRRMFDAVDCPVQELKRISIGDLYLARLREGDWRKLTPNEVRYLKSL